MYFAIETTATSAKQLQCLSSVVMRWTDEIWVVDVGPFLGYWQRIARQRRQSVVGIWKQILSQIFQPPFYGCGAETPWMAILGVMQLRRTQLSGVMMAGSESGRQIIQAVSWADWWGGVWQVVDHLEGLGVKGFNRGQFSTHARQFELAMQRLRIQNPAQLRVFSQPGITRRYGRWLAEIWSWMDQSKRVEETKFPWRTWVWQHPIKVRRQLEGGVVEWDQLKMGLCEDLDRLCEYLDDDQYVSQMDWVIIRESLVEQRVKIPFRNPHALWGERGHHRTALLQAYYQFMMLPEVESPIIGWGLILRGTLRIPPRVQALFEAWEMEGDMEKAIQGLENELPIPLQRFFMVSDWIPEAGYGEWDGQERDAWDDVLDEGLKEVAQFRPLYIYPEPIPIAAKNLWVRGDLIERTMDKWWQGADLKIRRHYYRAESNKNQKLWVYRSDQIEAIQEKEGGERGMKTKQMGEPIKRKRDETKTKWKGSSQKWYIQGIYG